MIDHIYLPVSDLKRSSEFYKKVLGPLGIDMPYEVGHLMPNSLHHASSQPNASFALKATLIKMLSDCVERTNVTLHFHSIKRRIGEKLLISLDLYASP